jgi:hypothetical protein
MCTELAVATKPWAWISFLLYLVVYFSVTIISPMWPVSRSLSIFVALGLGICGLASYVAAFSLYRDPLTFRRLGVYAKVGNWRRFCEEVPLWMVSMSMAGLFVIGCLALSFTPHYSQAWVEQLGFSAVVLWLLPMRDILILYYFTYGDSNRRVETSTIICLALLYWLMPSIIESMGLVKTSWMFRPPMEERPILSAIIISLHVLIASALCYRRYRSRIAPALN